MKTKQSWPPITLLEQLGMSKADWSKMVSDIESGELSRDSAIVKALMKSILGRDK